MGRLPARITLGLAAPTVWETQPLRHDGGDGALSLDGLITHTLSTGKAREACETAFGDAQRLKMMIDWRA